MVARKLTEFPISSEISHLSITRPFTTAMMVLISKNNFSLPSASPKRQKESNTSFEKKKKETSTRFTSSNGHSKAERERERGGRVRERGIRCNRAAKSGRRRSVRRLDERFIFNRVTRRFVEKRVLGSAPVCRGSCVVKSRARGGIRARGEKERHSPTWPIFFRQY